MARKPFWKQFLNESKSLILLRFQISRYVDMDEGKKEGRNGWKFSTATAPTPGTARTPGSCRVSWEIPEYVQCSFSPRAFLLPNTLARSEVTAISLKRGVHLSSSIQNTQNYCQHLPSRQTSSRAWAEQRVRESRDVIGCPARSSICTARWTSHRRLAPSLGASFFLFLVLEISE